MNNLLTYPTRTEPAMPYVLLKLLIIKYIKQMDIKVNKTERGFANIEFKDRYDHECTLQKSSLATEDAIWFGINDAKPLIMASKAKQYGLKVKDETGWIDYPIPEDVLLHTRMHLTQEQVKYLLPYLITFAETGELR